MRIFFIIMFCLWGIICGLRGNIDGALLAICVLVCHYSEIWYERTIKMQDDNIQILIKKLTSHTLRYSQ